MFLTLLKVVSVYCTIFTKCQCLNAMQVSDIGETDSLGIYLTVSWIGLQFKLTIQPPNVVLFCRPPLSSQKVLVL